LKTLYEFSLILLLAVILISCDEITSDYKQANKPNTDTTTVDTTKVLKILLEDYTGFKCGYCPAAGELARDLAALYPGRVILMSVHAGYFATPTSTHTYDFRSPEGEGWNDHFAIVGNPKGMVNRIKYEGSQVIEPSKWDAVIQSLLNSEAMMNIKLNTFFSLSRREITVDAVVTYIKDGKSSNQLVVNILEDSIVQYQTDYRKTPPDIYDFVHNHVFRASMNSTWGEALDTGDIKAGSVIRKSYIYKIPEGKNWRPEKLKIVAFVHDNGNTYEILQAEETEKIILII